jgi:hypothetical protein
VSVPSLERSVTFERHFFVAAPTVSGLPERNTIETVEEADRGSLVLRLTQGSTSIVLPLPGDGAGQLVRIHPTVVQAALLPRQHTASSVAAQEVAA